MVDRKNRSDLWQYFEALNLGSKKRKARCLHCQKIISYTTTTGNLRAHLGRCLPQVQRSLWKDFNVVDRVRMRARCLRCLKIYSFAGSTGNLRSHRDVCLLRPKPPPSFSKYFSQPDGENRSCELCQEVVPAESKDALTDHLRAKHPEVEIADEKQPDPPPQRSIWEDFEVADRREKKARCLRCFDLFSFASTTGNLRVHLRRCIKEPKKRRNSKSDEGEDASGQQDEQAEAADSGAKDLDDDFSRDDDLTDASCDRLDVSGQSREAKAWEYFSRGAAGGGAECRLCSEAVPADGPALVNHLLALHADAPLQQDKQEVVIETIYMDAGAEVPKSQARAPKAKRRPKDAEQARRRDGDDPARDKRLDSFAGYLVSVLKELPPKQSRHLELDFIAQVLKAREGLDRRKRKRQLSDSSDSDSL